MFTCAVAATHPVRAAAHISMCGSAAAAAAGAAAAAPRWRSEQGARKMGGAPHEGERSELAARTQQVADVQMGGLGTPSSKMVQTTPICTACCSLLLSRIQSIVIQYQALSDSKNSDR
jgi:hypothetical protein